MSDIPTTDYTTNWAGHVTWGARAAHRPQTVTALRDLVRNSDTLRVVGARHSFNAIADTPGDLVSLRNLPRRIEIDAAARTVTIDGGITFSELCPVLDAAGFALFNLPSIPDFTVIGAMATATHGSGTTNQILASAIAALEIVTASGDLIRLARGDDGFDGAVIGLGALGIVVALTLDLVPAFEVRQTVYHDLPFATVTDNLTGVFGGGYSVSIFDQWRGDTVQQVWVKSLASGPAATADYFGARAASAQRHPILELTASGGTAQLGVPGPWYDRLPHARIGVMPSNGSEFQVEYFVALSDGPAALRALKAVAPAFAPALIVTEIRTVTADHFWLSMMEGRESLALHFAFKPDWAALAPILPTIEEALRPFKARPHWGKLFTMPGAEVKALYPRLGDFRALAQRLDPDGKFRNAFIREYVF